MTKPKRLQNRTARIGRSTWAFTLVELLTVVAVIGVLAALILGLAGRAASASKDSRTRAMLAQLETAIESYKEAVGYYPPDNVNLALAAADPLQSWRFTMLNPLYYELIGTQLDNQSATYFTPDQSETIEAASVMRFFGVEGFVNTKTDGSEVQSFFDPKSDQYREISRVPDVELMVVPVAWPAQVTPAPANELANLLGLDPNSLQGINPWHYVSSNPTNNPGRFDLWAELPTSKKGQSGYEIRILSNWSDDPVVVER